MTREIIAERVLAPGRAGEVTGLYKRCNGYDGTHYVFDQVDDFGGEEDLNTFLLYEEGELAASLSLFSHSKAEGEIVALTRPDRRGTGCFRTLLDRALEEIRRREIRSLLFVCDGNSRSGRQTLDHLGAAYEYSEFLMGYRQGEGEPSPERSDITLAPARDAQKETLAAINARAFGDEWEEALALMEDFLHSPRRTFYTVSSGDGVIGMIGVYREPERNYIHGFCIDAPFRGKGIGKFVLTRVVEILKGEGKKIVLEVQTDNLNALKLYEDAGFVTEAEFRYCRSGRE